LLLLLLLLLIFYLLQLIVSLSILKLDCFFVPNLTLKGFNQNVNSARLNLQTHQIQAIKWMKESEEKGGVTICFFLHVLNSIPIGSNP
jgi:hypothetical protein